MRPALLPYFAGKQLEDGRIFSGYSTQKWLVDKMETPPVGSWTVEIKVNNAADSMRWRISNSFESVGDGGVSVSVGSHTSPLDSANLELRNITDGVQVVTEFNTADCLA